MKDSGADHMPRELRVSADKQNLTLVFDDGARVTLPAELLRTESPSAEVQGHAPSQKKIVTGKADVKIIGLEPQGHYAVKIIFDDGHDTGIFRWSYFLELAKLLK